ncbi:MAG: aminoacetone oxidase family FAD-binding enzyme [Halobacteriovorax sp.]|nr:aminoacetone oxidase family FAD-binding enzyme [Halobacteriovorax sp.]|tara:strand:- start:297317 stop:298486 length:1170 start_codon:yes stop_codon:yes gene_type:complete
MEKIIIIGGGPAGLFAAYKLLKKGKAVALYDHSSGLGKKFLVAGNGGLNLTHSEELKVFASRYGKDEELFLELINEFTPDDLRAFCSELGVETFVGSSGRVFPKKLKAAEILLNWTKILKENENFSLFLNHSLISINQNKELSFKNEGKEVLVHGDKIIMALGGGSWKKTGSDGAWVSMFENLGIKVNALLPMNCGFEKKWSEYFIKNVDRYPLKNIALRFKDQIIKGEAMLTPFGIEGGGVYALSNKIRDELLKKGRANLFLDLKPDLTAEQIEAKLADKKAKTSLSNHLRKSIGIEKEQFILLKEISSTEPDKNIKSLKLELTGIRPIDEAISTSGGVCFSELTNFFELKKIPGVYIAGEMLDFEAPTGGYLLQACFSTANRIVESI